MRNPFYFGSDPEEEEEEDPVALDNVPDLSDLIPDNPEAEEYVEHLKARPRAEEHKSSFGRKLGGGILSMLLGTDLGVTRAPYRKAMRDWTEEGSGLKEGAEVEAKENKEIRLAGQNIYTQKRAERRLALDNKKAERLYRQNEAKIKLLKDGEERRRKSAENLEQHRQTALKNMEKYRNAVIADKNRRTRILENKAGAGKQEKPLDPAKQAGIDNEARKAVAADPRFEKWAFTDNKGNIRFGDIVKLDQDGNEVINKETGQPEIVEELDENTKLMLEAALAKQKERVANMKRSDYSAMNMWAELGQRPNFFGEEEEEEVDPELFSMDEDDEEDPLGGGIF